MSEAIGYMIVVIRDSKKYYYGQDSMLWEKFSSRLGYGSNTKIFDTIEEFNEWWDKTSWRITPIKDDKWYLVALKEDFMHNHFKLETRKMNHAEACMKHYRIFEGSPK